MTKPLIQDEIYEIYTKGFLSSKDNPTGKKFFNKDKAQEECDELNKLLPNTYFVKTIKMSDNIVIQ